MKNKNLKKICVQEVPTVHGIGTGKTPPKLKLLAVYSTNTNSCT